MMRVAAFVQAVDQAFRSAVSAAGSFERRLTLVGLPVALRVAPAAPVADLTRAFAHLVRNDSAAPALTIASWDAASCEVARPPLRELMDALGTPDTAGGAAWAQGDGRPTRGPIYYRRECGLHVSYQPAPGILNVLDTTAGHAWQWVSDLSALPYWDYATPYRQILGWWLRDQRCVEVHGGAVGTPEAGGVLLGGRGGAGKSTSALATLGSELRFAGDDYVAVTESRPMRVHSLYCSAKLDSHGLDLLPHLRQLVTDAVRFPGAKAVLHVDRFPDASVATFPLRAILLPIVAGVRASRVVPVPPTTALRELAPSTILQLQPAAPGTFAAIAALARAVPAFRLELGSDMAAVPELISRLLSDMGGAEDS